MLAYTEGGRKSDLDTLWKFGYLSFFFLGLLNALHLQFLFTGVGLSFSLNDTLSDLNTFCFYANELF